MIRINLTESRAKRVKRFLKLLTEATLATGVVVDMDQYYDEAWLHIRPVDDDHATYGNVEWNTKTRRWEEVMP